MNNCSEMQNIVGECDMLGQVDMMDGQRDLG